MKIKKVDDKPMVIHTKKKAKLHTHEPKKASIKAANIYTVDRSPKIKGAKIATTENKKFPLIGIAVGKAVGDKIDKMDAQRNSRNRKIRFFLDKMKAEGEQQDSFAKLVKDLFVNKMAIPIKKIMVAVGGFLLVLSKLDEFDEEVIRYLIDYVLVYDNEHIEIRWNFDDFQAG